MAGVSRGQPGDQAQQGGFAGARRAEQSDPLSLFDVERYRQARTAGRKIEVLFEIELKATPEQGGCRVNM